jgi:NodT family efflux transporter outer membrane factor (OMF) lipoprotein
MIRQRLNLSAGPASVGGLCLLLATVMGCRVGPTFQTPVATPRPAFNGAPTEPVSDAQAFLQERPVPERWWTAFNCPELDRRIEAALSHSPTVASAQAALRRARESAVAAGAGRYPTVDATGNATRARAELEPGSPGAFVYTTYGASLSVSYTLDLFGGIRSGAEAAAAGAEFQRWLLEGTYLSLAGNVAAATFQEAGLGSQLEVAEAVANLLQEQEQLTARQTEIGVKTQADLLAVRTQAAAARAALPPLRKALEAVRNQLALYLGEPVAAGATRPVQLKDLTLPRELPLSLPSTVVRRRPDVRAAEAQLRAATAQVGVAAAQLLPQITLGAAYGYQNGAPGGLFQGANSVWNVGLNLLQPIFHGGALRAQKRAAEATLDQQRADYRQTVLAAFADVSNALDALRFDAQAEQASAEAEAAASQSLALEKDQYGLGAASYLQLLDATRAWDQARIGLITARSNRLADSAALYAALGGGWK